jgi:hypothetical protein
LGCGPAVFEMEMGGGDGVEHLNSFTGGPCDDRSYIVSSCMIFVTKQRWQGVQSRTAHLLNICVYVVAVVVMSLAMLLLATPL